MKLSTKNNCPKCSEQYWEFRQSQANRQSIHARIEYQHDNIDWCLKNRSVHDWLRKRVVDQNWVDYEQEGDEEEYVWQEGQWCPGGLTRSQKRRLQHLRNRELEQAQTSDKPQVWHAKQTVDRGQPSANIQMAFLLPSEFRAPADQEVYSDFEESEYEEIVAKLTVIQQAIFDNQSSIST